MTKETIDATVEDVSLVAVKKQNPIVQKLEYLYNRRIPFSNRVGVKNICILLSRDPVNNKITKEVKDFYEDLGEEYEAHGSGEYPFVVEPEQYDYLDFVNFTDGNASFTVDEKVESDFANKLEFELHQKAYSAYKKYHYQGSQEEAEDMRIAEELAYKEKNEEIIYAKQAVIDELEFLNDVQSLPTDDGVEYVDAVYILPKGAKYEIKELLIQLTIATPDVFFETLKSGVYSKFNGGYSKYNVGYTVKLEFEFWDFSVFNTVEKNEELLLELLTSFDNINYDFSVEELKLLKQRTVYAMHKVDFDIIDTPEYCNYDRDKHITGIEEYFEKQGVKGNHKISDDEAFAMLKKRLASRSKTSFHTTYKATDSTGYDYGPSAAEDDCVLPMYD